MPTVFLRVCSLLVVVIVLPVPLRAGLPLASFLTFKRVEADPKKSYTISQENGPWMILCNSFAGEGAEQEARRLVLELRKEYKLLAYTHRKKYDYTKSVRGIGFNKYGGAKTMRYAQRARYNEVAVLVGNFDSVEDPSLEKTLKKIKYARPESLHVGRGGSSTQRFVGWRAWQRRINGNKEKQAKGPMGHAFATRNPLLPKEVFVPGGLDKFVLDMNKGVSHSLLDCKARYSVRVATFRGQVIIDQEKIAKINRGGRMRSLLQDAAVKAHKLTEALRAQGVEAYEFHDRHESIVTVGSFQSVGTPRRDGKTEINPAVHYIMKQFGPDRGALGGGQTGLKPKSDRTTGIAFDVQPIPVEVPRRSMGAEYARGSSAFR